ncbi:LEM domain-containing protein 1 [Dipodomys merriami]|uniref:LEM domain-containing protein 1 n=1 Tax=Dipodomys merriami TaxID=94247 RepID=UPI003855D1DE
MVDVQCLSNCDLQIHLERLGFSPGPILPSTRKLYEKKLVQLLVLPPYEQPVVKELRKLRNSQDNMEELNIILKGNITLTTGKEKDKESKKRLKTYFSKARAVDMRCLTQMPASPIRSATPSVGAIHTQDLWPVAKGIEEKFSWGLGLAVLGIFIIVVFVYMTVENRPVLA